MIDPKKQRYVHYYNASAMALGGKITRPFEANLETQAPSVLPIDGDLAPLGLRTSSLGRSYLSRLPIP